MLGDSFQTRGFVYFLRDENTSHVKIGATSHPALRVRSIRSSLAHPILLIGIVTFPQRESAFKAERALHLKFSSRRVYGEWFALGSQEIPRRVNGGVVTVAETGIDLASLQLSRSISVRLTDAEYDTIVRMARAEGRTASNYLRFKLFPPKGK